MSAARDNQASLVHVIQSADSLISRLQSGEGSLGRLTTDTALYVETRRAVVELRELLADVKANPKRYFKVSVF
jgi:phospholipid/cholesterol/gamma-HCH transport system substrate-binding protein